MDWPEDVIENAQLKFTLELDYSGWDLDAEHIRRLVKGARVALTRRGCEPPADDHLALRQYLRSMLMDQWIDFIDAANEEEGESGVAAGDTHQ